MADNEQLVAHNPAFDVGLITRIQHGDGVGRWPAGSAIVGHLHSHRPSGIGTYCKRFPLRLGGRLTKRTAKELTYKDHYPWGARDSWPTPAKPRARRVVKRWWLAARHVFSVASDALAGGDRALAMRVLLEVVHLNDAIELVRHTDPPVWVTYPRGVIRVNGVENMQPGQHVMINSTGQLVNVNSGGSAIGRIIQTFPGEGGYEVEIEFATVHTTEERE